MPIEVLLLRKPYILQAKATGMAPMVAILVEDCNLQSVRHSKYSNHSCKGKNIPIIISISIIISHIPIIIPLYILRYEHSTNKPQRVIISPKSKYIALFSKTPNKIIIIPAKISMASALKTLSIILGPLITL